MAKRYFEICPCNPANGGSGICGCTIGDKLVDENKGYTMTSTTSTNINIPIKKQTAVDWLQEVYDQQGKILPTQFEQAKEIQKEQMFGYTQDRQIMGEYTRKYYSEDFEEYYNQTYKSNTSGSKE